MAHLIDKDAVVAEIDKRLHQLTDAAFDSMIGRNLIEIKDFLDTLEVKEVGLPNFEQEVKDFCYSFDDRKEAWYNMTPHDQNFMVSPTFANFAMQLAKHFFELGLKAQKGEKV